MRFHEPAGTPQDGVLHFNELDTGRFLDVTGGIGAGIDVELKLGVDVPLVGFVGISHSFEIASVRLIDLDSQYVKNTDTSGTSKVPYGRPGDVKRVIAGNATGGELVGSDGKLYLFTGSKAGFRKNVAGPSVDNKPFGTQIDGDESYSVKHISTEADGSETVEVTAFGVTQKFAGVRTILADGGIGNDTFLIENDVLASAELLGGTGKDRLDYRGNGRAILKGGGDDDALFGSVGNDDLDGEGGNDYIDAGGGQDEVKGGADNDTLRAGPGSTLVNIRGGAGNDQIFAGPGATNVFGLDGEDVITWAVGSGPLSINPEGDPDSPLGPDGRFAPGFDQLVVIGTAGPDSITVTDGSGQLRVQGTGFDLPTTGIEQINLDPGYGDDTVTVNKPTHATSVRRVTLNDVDGQGRDTIILNGSSAADAFDLHAVLPLPFASKPGEPPPPTPAAQERITGLGLEVYTPNFDNHIIVNAGGGDDTIRTDIASDVTPDMVRGPRGQLTLNGDGGNDTISVLKTFGPTAANGGAGDDTINVGGGDPRSLNSILAGVSVDGGQGFDTFTADDSGDTSANTGQLSATTLTGLGMSAGITYSALEAINVALGSGSDIFTIASTIAGTTTVTAGSGNDQVTVQSASGAVVVRGGEGNDTLTVDTLPTLQTQRDRPNDGAGVVRDTVDLDGQGGGDSYVVNVTGAGDYVVNVRDTGADAGTDTLTVNGTGQADTFLLRGHERRGHRLRGGGPRRPGKHRRARELRPGP